MKKLLPVILIVASLTTAAQNTYAQAAQQAADITSNAKDTVVVALYIKSDTVPVRYMAANNRGYVRLENGYAILKGFADSKGKYMQQPKISGVLNNRKKPVKQVIQIL